MSTPDNSDDDQRLRQLLAAGIDPASATATGGRAPWTPPTPAALAGVFPHLEVLELLGQGGMGAVYKARQTRLDRLVALKVLDPALGRDPAFAERFRREAVALARLAHPHIVALHDVGVSGEAGEWQYLLMEYVDGATMRQTLRTGRFSAGETLRLVPQLCDALAYAHGQGVVHRDLKPENILIDAGGRVRIADFGLAKLHDGGAGGDALTRTGELLGTAAYMAPEQVAGAPGVDHRADLYALGVVLYEMLTGQLPLGRFEPPSQRAQVDVRVDEVVLRALERAPELRWQSAAEVARAVGLAVAATAQAGAATTPPVAPAPTPPTAPRNSRTLLFLAVAGVVFGVGALALAAAIMTTAGRRDWQPVPVVAEPAAAPAAAPPQAIAVNVPGVSISVPVAPPPVVVEPLMVEPPAVQAEPLTPASPKPAVVQAEPTKLTSPKPEVVVRTTPSAPLADDSPVASAARMPTRPEIPATPSDVVPPNDVSPVEPPIAPEPPAPAAAIAPTTPAAPITALEIAGFAGVELAITAGAPPLTLERGRTTAGVSSATLTASGALRLVAAHRLRLEVPPDALTSVAGVDRSTVTLHGAAQPALTLVAVGSGSVIADGLAVDRLTVDHGGIGTVRLRGTAQHAELRSTATGTVLLTRTADGDLTLSGAALDARGLAVPDLVVDLAGTSQVLLAGHASSLRLTLTGSGSLQADELTVDAADLTMTGSGSAQLGRLGALDATCTGSGRLRYAGNPRLGRVVTTP